MSSTTRPSATTPRSAAAVLARAHAQSPRAAEVAGYIGNGRMVGEAILEWAYAYAALSKSDFDAFVAAHPKPESGTAEAKAAVRALG